MVWWRRTTAAISSRYTSKIIQNVNDFSISYLVSSSLLLNDFSCQSINKPNNNDNNNSNNNNNFIHMSDKNSSCSLYGDAIKKIYG